MSAVARLSRALFWIVFAKTCCLEIAVSAIRQTVTDNMVGCFREHQGPVELCGFAVANHFYQGSSAL
jgi:hypothetical protein